MALKKSKVLLAKALLNCTVIHDINDVSNDKLNVNNAAKYLKQMNKTTSHTNGVLGIIFLAQQVNPEIGSYQEHFLNELFNFTVKLTNGTIYMTLEDAQDYEARPSSVTSDRYQNIAKTFKKL